MTTHEAANRNPLVLAFIGDAYWTLLVREKIVKKSQEKVNILHLEANKFVCATSQCKYFTKIAPFLTETESSIAGRARNTHQHTTAKNATLGEYKLATAFEAVIGYNFLIGDQNRLDNLCDIILEDFF